jgi:hypothetical protein
MRKLYSLVLMAAALLIGTNVFAADVPVQGNDLAALKAAINAAGTSGKVTLTQPIVATVGDNATEAGVWIGTVTEGGTAQSITLDLAGNDITFQTGDYKKSGVQTAQTVIPFVITKGMLKIESKDPKSGAVIPATIKVKKGTSAVAAGTNVFYVFGTYNKVNPKGNNPFSYLEIGEKVTAQTENGTVIAVDALRSGGVNTSGDSTYVSKGKTVSITSTMAVFSALARATSYGVRPAYSTDYYTGSYGFAFGVHVEVDGTLISQGDDATKCYGIKTNGLLAYPGDTKKTARSGVNEYAWMSGYTVSESDAQCAPYIHVSSKGKLQTSNENLSDASAAAYCSGYAQWKVEGACDGATGLYASSGDIDIDGAKITSGADWYNAPGGTGHADGGGSAIVINSRDAYAGAIDVEISGTTEVSAVSGYAIEEAVNTTTTDPGTPEEKQETKVENITITGGTFQGGTNPVSQEQQPAIIISNPTAKDDVAEVVVYGGNIEGPVVVNGDDEKSLEDFLDPEVHTTTIIVDGNTVTVVSEGEAPAGQATVAGHSGESVKWISDSETLGEDLTLAELEINENDTTWDKSKNPWVIKKITPHAQTLTIQSGVTFTVGRAVLGEAAQIIVEQGARFIVNDDQGVVAPNVRNIVLKSSESNPAIFVFHPGVTANRNPKATVEFISKAHIGATKNVFQRFGLPMKKDGLDTIYAAGNPETRFYAFDLAQDKWVGIGYINPSAAYESQKLDYSKLNNPFEYYQMMNFDATTAAGVVYTMEGNLLGNSEPTMEILENSWKGFANSYMGKVKLSVLLQLIPNTVDKAIYLYDVNATYASWNPVTNLNSASAMLNPMQPFLIRNRYASADVEFDYEHAVYNPTVGIANPAPFQARRIAANEMTMATIRVSGENSADQIIVAEHEDFTAEFDNGYDAAKYMNEGINMYVSADEKMSNFATDKLENTYVGFQAVENGAYTIEFTDVHGEELTLIDHETGARVAMVEGNVYEFTANGTNDYRFEIVNTFNAPTAIENTEAVKSAKGIYTVTGQFVGEMNVWNTLPAGIYVVNGEKLVK